MVNHYANIPNNGNGLRHYNLAKQLVLKGYDVTIFRASAAHNYDFNNITDKTLYVEDTVDGVKFVSIRAISYKGNNHKRVYNILQFCHNFKKAGKILGDKNPPDVVIGSSMHPLALYAAASISKRYKCRYIEEIRDLWPETLLSIRPGFNKAILKMLYRTERKLYLKADKLIFTIAGGYDYLAERGWSTDFDPLNVYYLNNGIDLDQFNENIKKYPFADSDLDDKRLFKAVYTGSIGHVNNIGLLIETAKILSQKKYDDIKILVWGDGPELSNAEKEVEENNISNIIFKHAVVKKYIPSILSKANLSLMHNEELPVHRFGTSQNKKFDYLAAGKPIISTAKSGYDILEKRKAGLTLEMPTADLLADAIIYFRNLNETEYAEYSNNALELAREYDFKMLVNTLISAIED